jgi:hypothetical protein
MLILVGKILLAVFGFGIGTIAVGVLIACVICAVELLLEIVKGIRLSARAFWTAIPGDQQAFAVTAACGGALVCCSVISQMTLGR